MHVLVTGATGFVGAYSTKALADAGHEVRLLVRDPARIGLNVTPLGVDVHDFAVGDMLDERVVATAMDGCDAVLHCAALVDLERRHAEQVLGTNIGGVRTVVGCAMDRGLDPIVYVSSVSALFSPGIPLVHDGLPPADVVSGYGKSKAVSEAFVRRLQTEGAPITTTYPGGVLAPPAGTAFGEMAESITYHLKMGVIPMAQGAWSVIDARDLAAIHAAVLEPGKGPRRYMCGGNFLTMPDTARIYREVTGRRFPVVPLPGACWRGFGRAVDALTRVLPFDTLFTTEGMEILTRWVPTDDRKVLDELGVTFRDPRETFTDAIKGYLAGGRISPKHAGYVAASYAAS